MKKKSLRNCKRNNIRTQQNLWWQIEKRAKVYVFVSITNDMLRNNNDESCRKSDVLKNGEIRRGFE